MGRNPFSISRIFLSTVLVLGTMLITGLVTTTPARADCSQVAEAGIDWSGCRKRSLILSDTTLSNSKFIGTDLSSSDLRNSELSMSDFEKANLVRASLKGAIAKKANFSNSLASRTDFSEGDFEESKFQKAETSRTNFSNSNLQNSDFSRGEFARANFSGANITGVNFDFSNLARADFRNSNYAVVPSFSNSYFFQTRIEGMDLSKADELKQWQIDLACGDKQTKLPAGLQAPSSWPCE